MTARVGACLPAPLSPQVFRAAVDLKLRRLLTECLVQLLPQFGRCTADTTGARARLGCGCLPGWLPGWDGAGLAASQSLRRCVRRGGDAPTMATAVCDLDLLRVQWLP